GQIKQWLAKGVGGLSGVSRQVQHHLGAGRATAVHGCILLHAKNLAIRAAGGVPFHPWSSVPPK
ncbi:hypothetical protein HaLaN_08773, partial [Haematococcus lacustris]